MLDNFASSDPKDFGAGFQLWLNLPGKTKMRAPWYRDIQSDEIPEVTTPEGITVRIIAGAGHGVQGAMQREDTEPSYLHLVFPDAPSNGASATAPASFIQPLPASHNAFIYVYRGSVSVVDAAGIATPVPRNRMAILTNGGNGVTLQADATPGSEPARALLIAGKPLNEPIAQHGPFVMNTRQELKQAVDDFNSGRLA